VGLDGPVSRTPANDAGAEHRHRVVDDLAIIQAQARVIRRQIATGKSLDPARTDRRLGIIIEAVRRLARRHR